MKELLIKLIIQVETELKCLQICINLELGKEKAEAMHGSMQGLMEASEAEVFDETAVRRAYKAVATAGEEMAVHRAAFVAELRDILNPEQWQEFLEIRDARLERKETRQERNPRFIDQWLEINIGEEGNG